ncbi:SRPBCC family protein [Cryptosporangium sp. NPDC048952]|uniref:SRPBCC family protein n=1 Tax=Cryptosporangium sp. NPDC048952 TaxID=3363961 RepID=UPI00371532E7
MAGIYRSATVQVSPDVAWAFLEAYARSDVHVFSACVAERQVDDYRVVTTKDGREIWERIVTTDPVHRRASYTVPGLTGTEFHHAEMHVGVDPDGATRLTWITDMIPHELSDERIAGYDLMFDELVAAVHAFGER